MTHLPLFCSSRQIGLKNNSFSLILNSFGDQKIVQYARIFCFMTKNAFNNAGFSWVTKMLYVAKRFNVYFRQTSVLSILKVLISIRFWRSKCKNILYKRRLIIMGLNWRVTKDCLVFIVHSPIRLIVIFLTDLLLYFSLAHCSIVCKALY